MSIERQLCELYRSLAQKQTSLEALLGGSFQFIEDEFSAIFSLICEVTGAAACDYSFDAISDYCAGVIDVEECLRQIREVSR